MQIPPKLTHGDNFGNLFEKFNALIDYLREIHLIAGHGIRINRLPAGTTIESISESGVGVSGATNNLHPFDAKIINKGTDSNPDYYVKIYDSALPDSSCAGIVYVGETELQVPVSEVKINTDSAFFVDLSVTYTGTGNIPFSVSFSLRPYETPIPTSDTTYYVSVAAGLLSSKSVASRVSGDITVTGRWV